MYSESSLVVYLFLATWTNTTHQEISKMNYNEANEKFARLSQSNCINNRRKKNISFTKCT